MHSKVLGMELEGAHLAKRDLMAKLELAQREKQHLVDQHQWELNLLRENLNLEVTLYWGLCVCL